MIGLYIDTENERQTSALSSRLIDERARSSVEIGKNNQQSKQNKGTKNQKNERVKNQTNL